MGGGGNKVCTCERFSFQKAQIKRIKQSREYLKEMKGSTTEEELNETVIVFPVTQDTCFTEGYAACVIQYNMTFNHSQCLKVNSLENGSKQCSLWLVSNSVHCG